MVEKYILYSKPHITRKIRDEKKNKTVKNGSEKMKRRITKK